MPEIHPSEFRRVYKGKAGSEFYHMEGKLEDFELEDGRVSLMALDIDGSYMIFSTRTLEVEPAHLRDGTRVQVSAVNGDGDADFDVRFLGLFIPKTETPVCYASRTVQ